MTCCSNVTGSFWSTDTTPRLLHDRDSNSTIERGGDCCDVAHGAVSLKLFLSTPSDSHASMTA
jgi:hypothetical protein